MSRPLRKLFDDFVDSLVGSFAITRVHGAQGAVLELAYIRDVERVDGRYVKTYLFMTEKEIELKTDAIQYYLTDDNDIERCEIDTIILNVESTQIIPITHDNIVSLLIDKNKLVRKAAEEWYAGKPQRESNRVKA